MSISTNPIRSVALCGHTKCATRWMAEVIKSAPGFTYVHWSTVTNGSRESLSEEIATSERVLFIDFPWAICRDEDVDLLLSIDPNMAGIVIYREPIDALLSAHNYSRPAYGEGSFGGPGQSVSYEEHVADKDFVRSAKNGQLANVLKASYSYDENAQRLRKRFKRYAEFLYEDIRDDKADFIERLFSFCGVDLQYTMPGKPVNKSVSYRSYFLHKVTMKVAYMLTGVHTKTFLYSFANDQMAPSLLKSVMQLNHKDPHFLTESQKRELRELVSPMISRLKKISDIDLEKWRY